MDEERTAPAERQLGAGQSRCFRLGTANENIANVAADGNGKYAMARADVATAAMIWRRAKALTAQGRDRGVRADAVAVVNAWHAMQAGQRGDLHALEAWRIAFDASRGVLRGEVRP